MDLEQALVLHPDGDGWTADIPDGWGQGRTTFGGLLAGYLTRAVEAAVPRPVCAVDVTFLEPVAPGQVRITIDGVREGKYVTHAHANLYSAGQVAATARFLLADHAPGRFDTVPPAPAPSTAFDDCIAMPYIPGLTPEFSQNMEIRIGEGAVPFSGADRAGTGGYIRTAGPSRGVAALLTHIDAWPPAVLALTDTPAAASTIRWHVMFHADMSGADGQQWSWFRAEAPWRSGRLATAVGSLVRDGRSVAYAEQTVAMYF